MPWDVRKEGEKWVVVKKDGGKVMGEHGSEEEANEQLRALHANVHDDSLLQRDGASRFFGEKSPHYVFTSTNNMVDLAPIKDCLATIRAFFSAHRSSLTDCYLVGSWVKQLPDCMPDRGGKGTSDIDILFCPKPGSPIADTKDDAEQLINQIGRMGRALEIRYVDPIPGSETVDIRETAKSVSPAGSRSSGRDEILEDALFMDGEQDWVILADNISDGLMRVRQKATCADALNLNNRIYPREVLRRALGPARERARAGAMLSELEHPSIAKKKKRIGDSVKEIDVYEDRHDAKSARIDDISDVGADGWVTVDRTILDTPAGREVARAFREGKPYGISKRFTMDYRKARVGDKEVWISKDEDISTFDDVRRPAFPDAGKQYTLLTDEIRTELDLNPKGEAMNPKIGQALNRFYVLFNQRASVEQIVAARKLIADAITEAQVSGENIVEASRELLRVDADMNSAGYRPGKPAPNLHTMNTMGDVGYGAGWGMPAEGGGAQGMNAPGGTPPHQEEKEDLEKASDATVTALLKKMGMTEEDFTYLRDRRSQETRAAQDAEKRASVKTACDSLRVSEKFRNMSAEHLDYIFNRVEVYAASADAVATLADAELEAFSKIVAKERLRAVGVGGGSGTGRSLYDPSSPENLATRDRGPAYMDSVDKLLAAADDHHKMVDGTFDAADVDVKRLRKYNRENFIDQMIEEYVARHAKSSTMDEWFKSCDSLCTDNENAFLDEITQAADAVTTANLWNQPSIAVALIVQRFQDMEMLQFVHGIGPGLDAGSGGFVLTGNNAEGQVGSVLRIPMETYTPPTGYGAISGNLYDEGLLVPEDTGIDEASISTIWAPFAPYWRRIAISFTRDTIRAMGNGPLNYSAVGRGLYHIGYDKARRIDTALANEVVNGADEAAAVSKSDDTTDGTYGANLLANNTVYLGAGSVTVNLNPAKAANAAVAATDPAVTYGTNVVAAIRLRSVVSNPSAAPFFGTANGANPIVRPRGNIDLSAAGQLTVGTPLFNFTVVGTGSDTANGATPVLGAINSVGSIVTRAGGGATANCAIDWNNGVLVMTIALAAAGGQVTNNAGVLANVANRGLVIAYWYATNFDNFIVNNPTLATGEVPATYYNRIFAQIDVSCALMGSAPRYVTPNLGIMSRKASTWITQASIFYTFNSPTGTDLFPTSNIFFERTGLRGARINAPWVIGDTRIVLTRKGTTKYAIDTPFEMRGPYPSYDSNGKIKSKEIFYAEENSVICTPQLRSDPVNNPQTVINPFSRSIILR